MNLAGGNVQAEYSPVVQTRVLMKENGKVDAARGAPGGPSPYQ